MNKSELVVSFKSKPSYLKAYSADYRIVRESGGKLLLERLGTDSMGTPRWDSTTLGDLAYPHRVGSGWLFRASAQWGRAWDALSLPMASGSFISTVATFPQTASSGIVREWDSGVDHDGDGKEHTVYAVGEGYNTDFQRISVLVAATADRADQIRLGALAVLAKWTGEHPE